MDSKITIITPTYNRAKTLPRVYKALKEQIFKDFIWIIMDDGSTDQTQEIVQEFIKENILQIQYFYNENQHKFITVFEGIKKVKSPYFIIMDSDDPWPKNSFSILLDAVSSIKNQNEFIGVMGNSEDENGNLVGTLYPGKDGFIGSIFDMRYKYKVKGDKNGILITESYLKELEKFDYSIYQGKGYIPQGVFFSIYDAKGLKTKFINKIIRTYYKDEADANSVSNTRKKGKNVFGLRELYKAFLNNYNRQFYRYPKSLCRNLIGFEYYTIISKKGLLKSIKEIRNPFYKILYIILLGPIYFYYILKK